MNIKINKRELPYRAGVGIVLINSNKQVFAARRIDTKSEAWQMPQGGIDKGEKPEVAAIRELKEEVGTDKAKIIAVSKEWHSYDLPEHLIGKLWNGRFRGQQQKWFLMKFIGTDNDINIETEEPEFIEWKWVKPEVLNQMIVPFKRELYDKIFTEFKGFF